MTTFPRTLDGKIQHFADMMKRDRYDNKSFYRALVRLVCDRLDWKEECSKCLGTGRFSCWSHVSNGRCFRCMGAKFAPVLDKKNCVKLEAMIADGSIIEKVIDEDNDTLAFISSATNALLRAKTSLAAA